MRLPLSAKKKRHLVLGEYDGINGCLNDILSYNFMQVCWIKPTVEGC